jgi:signal transduction histidine kinase
MGISPELLLEFESTGSGAGVGLAGMRERVRELGGQLRIESDNHGTRVVATVNRKAA